MSFIRDEAAKTVSKYKELIVSAALVALGAYWAFFTYGLLPWVGWAVMILAGIVAFTYLQRARFLRGAGGLGVVEVDEGQIAYFSPLEDLGGAVAVRELAEVSYDARAGQPKWILRQVGLPELSIPANAEGAGALFDALAALPGLSPDRLIGVQRGAKGQTRVIWRAEALTSIDTPRAPLHS